MPTDDGAATFAVEDQEEAAAAAAAAQQQHRHGPGEGPVASGSNSIIDAISGLPLEAVSTAECDVPLTLTVGSVRNVQRSSVQRYSLGAAAEEDSASGSEAAAAAAAGLWSNEVKCSGPSDVSMVYVRCTVYCGISVVGASADTPSSPLARPPGLDDAAAAAAGCTASFGSGECSGRLQLGVRVGALPRRARLLVEVRSGDSSVAAVPGAGGGGEDPPDHWTLGWAAVPLFAWNGRFGSGQQQLRLWPERAEAIAEAEGVSRPFPSWNRSILAEIYLCHACSCQEILRTETAGQGGHRPDDWAVPARPAARSVAQNLHHQNPLVVELQVDHPGPTPSSPRSRLTVLGWEQPVFHSDVVRHAGHPPPIVPT
eukprot:COSAG01_NODE_629_length_14689_cov_298.955517_7_plen_370_part_00